MKLYSKFIGGALLLAAAAWLGFDRIELSGWFAQNGIVLRQAAVSGVLIGGVYGLVALGLTLIFGVMRIINFAHGTLLTVGMYLTYILYDRFGLDPYLSLVITAPALFLLGLVVQRLIIQPARHAPEHNQLLLTLGLALFLQNLMLVIFTATPRSLQLNYGLGKTSLGPVLLDFPLHWFGTTITLPKLAAFIFALLLALGLYLLLQHTRLGKAIRAVSEDREGAMLAGINPDRINQISFGLGTACLGAAASLILPFFFVTPLAGDTFNITTFVIVVLGGLGSVPGALLGGLIVGLVQELGGVLVPASSKLLSVFILFILALLFRPQGLLGRSS